MTPKQQRFVQEYLIDLHATNAAIRAGYAKEWAGRNADRLTKNKEIATAIASATAKLSTKADISAERVLKEIAAMAFYDPADLMIDGEAGDDDREAVVINGRVIYGLRGPADIKRLPEKVRRAIVGWSWDKNLMFTVKLADKSKALDQLARHLALYNDKLEVTGLDGWADRVARAKARGNARA
jgi:phage terminase small subunit